MSLQQKEQQQDTNTTASSASTEAFQWNALAILQAIIIFILAGFAEIIGGWLIWVAVKGIRVQEEMPVGTLEVGNSNNTHNDVTTNVNDETIYNESNAQTSQYTTIKKPWYYALLGSLTLIAYGFLPCLQPSAASDGFARIYAAYGGFFIVLSFLLGWALEGSSAKPDVGDLVGGGISLVGVGVIMFWPRGPS
ncbi:hypothetical protein HJC23_006722 [Cyclotella cryptica]|uniref:Uncharacterized protein n=1 Tax=Cyclotella cryptica TaxID=29204 RepID=A0ABD3PNQ1_9STRA|eukprot:CCRYP_012719-RA/>CCRYP_012719-RA protein AED:0.31 eAED:0.31 QI:0/-1/0/1/-1/1/1/0/192